MKRTTSNHYASLPQAFVLLCVVTIMSAGCGSDTDPSPEPVGGTLSVRQGRGRPNLTFNFLPYGTPKAEHAYAYSSEWGDIIPIHDEFIVVDMATGEAGLAEEDERRVRVRIELMPSQQAPGTYESVGARLWLDQEEFEGVRFPISPTEISDETAEKLGLVEGDQFTVTITHTDAYLTDEGVLEGRIAGSFAGVVAEYYNCLGSCGALRISGEFDVPVAPDQSGFTSLL